jgi:hypothetical protein
MTESVKALERVVDGAAHRRPGDRQRAGAAGRGISDATRCRRRGNHGGGATGPPATHPLAIACPYSIIIGSVNQSGLIVGSLRTGVGHGNGSSGKSGIGGSLQAILGCSRRRRPTDRQVAAAAFGGVVNVLRFWRKGAHRDAWTDAPGASPAIVGRSHAIVEGPGKQEKVPANRPAC